MAKTLVSKTLAVGIITALQVVSFAACACATSHSTTESQASQSTYSGHQVLGNPDPSKYPDKWWEPVPKEGAPSWEILPQEAGPHEVILSKRTELGILSNFAATPFTYRGVRYASLEGFWQMMKYPEGPDDPRAKATNLVWKFTRAQVSQMTAFDAKNAGKLGEENMKTLGINWVTFEAKQMEYRFAGKGDFYAVIHEAMWEKLQQNPEVKKILKSTGDLVLKPDHQQDPSSPAAWKYFEIWTEYREKI